MSGWLKSLLCKCEIDLKAPEKNARLYGSSRELVAMLFAVVVGVGLEKINSAIKTNEIFSYFQLAVVYIAIILSWWGYNYGTIMGPNETNLMNYGIDCLLLVLYWALINWWDKTEIVIFGFVLMFALYWLWELIRLSNAKRSVSDRQKISEAATINLWWTVSIGLLFIYFIFLKEKLICLGVLFVLIAWYRIKIHRIYSIELEPFTSLAGMNSQKRQLIDAARSIVSKARVHLSKFPVGAAVLSETGKIYVGCNVEFDNYSNTIHAEEAAISALIAAGEEKVITAAVFTLDEKLHFPCGMCRQSLAELGGEGLSIIACNAKTSEEITIKELLPQAFHL